MRNVVEVLLVANYFGRESLGTIKGFTAPFRAVSPIGPVLAGFIRDKTGSYDLAFIIFASVAILMLVLMLGAKQPYGWQAEGPDYTKMAQNPSGQFD